jgi:concentrative nucleoside transporter, CNT family
MTFDGSPMTSGRDVLEDKFSDSTASLPNEKKGVLHSDVEVNDVDVNINIGEDPPPTRSWFSRNRVLMRRVKLCAFAALILAWWISATVLPATRHRWIVQTFWAWSFIAIIAFRFIPNSVVTRPVEAVWVPLVQRPFFTFPKYARYGLGWLALIAIVMGSAFGFKLENVGLSLMFLTRCVWFSSG